MLYGQDVGKRLGGVHLEKQQTLAQTFGDNRVFNEDHPSTIGSTVGGEAVGLKPIVKFSLLIIFGRA